MEPSDGAAIAAAVMIGVLFWLVIMVGMIALHIIPLWKILKRMGHAPGWSFLILAPFGTLIGLLHKGEPVLGAIHIPPSGELCIGAKGHPTTVNGSPVKVRDTAKLADATMLYTNSQTWWQGGHGEAFQRLQGTVALSRGWGDCYGHFMVAAGRADM